LRLFDVHEAVAIRNDLIGLTLDRTAVNHSNLYLSFLDGDPRVKGALEQAVTERLAAALAPHLAAGRIQNGGAIVKNAGADALAIHHHMPVTDSAFQREIVCWCPLTDVDENSGALQVVPRSHHLLPFIRVPRGRDYFEGFADRLADYAVPLPARAGEAILLDNTLLHGSAPNNGAEPRYAISVQIVPDDACNGLYLDPGDGFLDFVEVPPADAFRRYLETGTRPREWRTAKRIRNANQPIGEAEFRRLLDADPKVRGLADPRPDAPAAREGLYRKLLRGVRGQRLSDP
jgi:hypothetical protein